MDADAENMNRNPTFFHGSHDGKHVMHEGICLTDDEQIARVFAGHKGTVARIELVDEELRYEEVNGYDHDMNTAPADSKSVRSKWRRAGIDFVTYDDEDELGQPFTCVRLLSPKALKAATIEILENESVESNPLKLKTKLLR